ncbi:MAG: glycosyltransferase family 1 protein [Planctomycetes bacterium B3_Pla]|nr:MAG: glycosyltransferase family 1 protein [Planctomycetes bacterium B3_Pla]
MKLIHITTVPFTFRFFHGQIAFLKSRGIEVHAISSPGDELGALEEVEQREAIKVHPVSMQRRISPFRDLVSLWRLWRLLRREQPAIVHSHTPKAGLLGTIATRAARTKVVLLSIFGVRQMTKTGFSRRLLDFTTWLSCKLADCIWCDSFSVRDYIVAKGLCASKKAIVLGHGSVMGVDAREAFSPSKCGPDVRNAVRAEYGIPTNAMVLGFVGRIAADKGMRELASAWRNLRSRYPLLYLMLVGPTDATDPVSAEDEALFRTDDRVHLCGYCEDLPAHLAAMDLFVMPSYREGFGIVNIEAAAMALPVVSTRIPGCIDSVQDGVTGTLVAPRDADALRDAIEKYLEDPSLREQHGQAGRKRALQDFRPEDIWESLFRLYMDLAEQKGIVGPGVRKSESKPHVGMGK